MNSGIKLFLMVSLATVVLAGTASATLTGVTLNDPAANIYINGTIIMDADIAGTNASANFSWWNSSIPGWQLIGTNITSGTNFKYTLDTTTIPDSNYTFNVIAWNDTDTVSDINTNVTIDNNAPTLSNLGPSGFITSTSPTMTVTTSEIADCKYHTSNVAYAIMSYGFSAGNGTTSHSTVLGPFGYGSSHTYYVACIDVGGNPSATSSTSFRVAGAGGGLPPVVTPVERISQANSMGAGEIGERLTLRYTLEIVAVTKIEFTLANEVMNLKIEVKSLGSSLPSGLTTPQGTVYRYIDFITTNIGDEDLSDGATITFEMTKTWFTNNGIEPGTTKLQKWTGSVWEQLTTTQTNSDNTHYYFEAETTGFSRFAITAGIVTPPGCTEGATQACTTTQNCPGTQTCTAGTWGACADVPNDSCPTEGNGEEPTPAGINYMWIIAIVVVIIIIAFIAMTMRKK